MFGVHQDIRTNYLFRSHFLFLSSLDWFAFRFYCCCLCVTTDYCTHSAMRYICVMHYEYYECYLLLLSSLQMLQSSNKYSATASVLSEFLPVMDTLVALRAKYGDDEFGQQYNALPGAIKSGFTAMGCTEYTVHVGDAVDAAGGRVVAVESEYSEQFAENVVLRPIAAGLELQGNVIRAAQVVASLGKEPPAAPAAVQDEEEKEAASAEDTNEEEASSSSSSSEA